METAGYDSPCEPDQELLNIGGDVETQEMKALFELCYLKKEGEWIKKKDIVELIIKSEEDLFSYINFQDRSDQTKFGKKLKRFIGRILSGIILQVNDIEIRGSRQEFKFIKETGNMGNVGNVHYPENTEKKDYILKGSPYPKLPKLPKNQDIDFSKAGMEDLE